MLLVRLKFFWKFTIYHYLYALRLKFFKQITMKRTLFLFVLLSFSASTFSHSIERNIFIVLINTYDQLFVESAVMDIEDLKDAVKEYIANPNSNPNCSEKYERDIKLLGKVMVSKGIISIQCDRNTTYQKYIDVQNELEKAFNELRNDLAWKKFNNYYKKLSKEKQRAINRAIPKNISEVEPRNVRGISKSGYY